MDKNLILQNRKLELIQWISATDDISLIEKLIELRKNENSDWWNAVSKSEKEAIELGLKDAGSGKLNAHDKARRHYEKWL